MSLIIQKDRCRTCLNEGIAVVELSTPVSIYDETMLLNELLSITAIIEILPNDGKPQGICFNCITDARNCYNFKKRCQDSDVLLQQELDNCIEDNATNKILTQSKVSTELLEMNIVKSEHEELNFEEKTLNMKVDYDTEDHSSVKDNVLSQEEFRHILEDHMVTIPNKLDTKKGENISNVGILSQNGKKVFNCDKCEKVFKTKSQYTKHKKKHEQCYCDYCDYFNENPVLVHNHKLVVHADMRKYKCTFCGVKLFTETELEKHMKSHSGIITHFTKRKMIHEHFNCDYCDYFDMNPDSMDNHKRAVHADMRKYDCNSCSKKFFTEVQLKIHMIQHADPKVEYVLNL